MRILKNCELCQQFLARRAASFETPQAIHQHPARFVLSSVTRDRLRRNKTKHSGVRHDLEPMLGSDLRAMHISFVKQQLRHACVGSLHRRKLPNDPLPCIQRGALEIGPVEDFGEVETDSGSFRRTRTQIGSECAGRCAAKIWMQERIRQT